MKDLYESQKRYYQNNKEKILEQQRNSRSKTASKMIYRAKERNKFPVNIDRDDLLSIWPKDNLCPILGIEMVVGNDYGGRGTSPSLDRIDSSRGYEKDNIQIISCRANIMKSDASEEELVSFAKWVLSNT